MNGKEISLIRETLQSEFASFKRDAFEPLRKDVVSLRGAVQQRGEKLAEVAAVVKSMGNCGANAEAIENLDKKTDTIDTRSRDNTRYIVELVLGLAGIVAAYWVTRG